MENGNKRTWKRKWKGEAGKISIIDDGKWMENERAKHEGIRESRARECEQWTVLTDCKLAIDGHAALFFLSEHQRSPSAKIRSATAEWQNHRNRSTSVEEWVWRVTGDERVHLHHSCCLACISQLTSVPTAARNVLLHLRLHDSEP